MIVIIIQRTCYESQHLEAENVLLEHKTAIVDIVIEFVCVSIFKKQQKYIEKVLNIKTQVFILLSIFELYRMLKI